jgi:hypothetical protein
MGFCTNHPDRETRFQCMKHGTYLCEECLNCRDPNIYCKHRSSCMIRFIEKNERRPEAEEKPATPAP